MTCVEGVPPGSLPRNEAGHLAGWRTALAVLIGAQIFIWGVLPTLFVTSLHQDTLEIIYWSRDFALGYYKHPPLASWLLSVLVQPDHSPVIAVCLIGAVIAAISAVYVFRTVGLFAPQSSALVAAGAFLASRSATFLSPMVNHNSLLIPFWAALGFYGLRYFERRRWGDALAAGLCAGLGFITKYEILPLMEALFVLALMVPRYRSVFRQPATLASAALAAAIVTPHLIWLRTHPASIDYAVEVHDIQSVFDFLNTVNHFVVGHLLVGLGCALAVLALRLSGWKFSFPEGERRFALLVGLLPSAFLGIMTLIAWQVMRDGWIDPLTPSFAVGLGLAVRLDRAAATKTHPRARFVGWIAAMSFVQLVGFFLLLFVRAQIGKPVAAYDLDARNFAQHVDAYWRSHHHRPLSCMVVEDHLVTAAPTVWLHEKPHVVELGLPNWSHAPKVTECDRNGAVVVLQNKAFLDRVPGVCRASVEPYRVASPLSGGRAGWNVLLYDLPPGGHGCAATPHTSMAPPSTK